ncbi:MAG: PqqD family protein [Candidatus Rokubacteria bacterium]|nr:PqqD family protein [Candidatus Rokubacteria bacterium]
MTSRRRPRNVAALVLSSPQDSRFARDPDFISRRVVDEVILLPIRKNMGDLESIYALNEVGARIWELLDGERSVGDVRDVLVGEFDVPAETLVEHVDEFVGHLESIGAIKRAI